MEATSASGRGLYASASGSLPLAKFLDADEADSEAASSLRACLCLVCFEVAVLATRTSCGHIFCEACIYSLLDLPAPLPISAALDCDAAPLSSDSSGVADKAPTSCLGCPQGCGTLRAQDLSPASDVRAQLAQRSVRCANSSAGCGFTGPLGACATVHETAECSFRHVRCAKCARRMPSHTLAAHTSTECPMREIACPHCGPSVSFRARDAAAHAAQCPREPVACPEAGCGATGLLRETLFSHLTFDCALHTRPCSFAAIGCTHRARQDALDRHAADDAIAMHVPLLLQAVTQLQRERDDSRRAHAALLARVEHLEHINRHLMQQHPSATPSSSSSAAGAGAVADRTASPAEVVLALASSRRAKFFSDPSHAQSPFEMATESSIAAPSADGLECSTPTSAASSRAPSVAAPLPLPSSSLPSSMAHATVTFLDRVSAIAAAAGVSSPASASTVAPLPSPSSNTSATAAAAAATSSTLLSSLVAISHSALPSHVPIASPARTISLSAPQHASASPTLRTISLAATHRLDASAHLSPVAERPVIVTRQKRLESNVSKRVFMRPSAALNSNGRFLPPESAAAEHH
jgi:hypothetical protein